MDKTNEIIKEIISISGKYSAHAIFRDWVECCAIFISNSTDMIHGELWNRRERRYVEIMQKYEKPERIVFPKLFDMLVETLEAEMKDVLGYIYMKTEQGSKHLGQFFTPYHLSLLTAKIGAEQIVLENGKYKVNEPACGGGAMIIAMAQVLKDKGYNYQTVMDVIAQDLDWNSVYMCYLQLSLLGIKAVVVQGDTLGEPYITGYPKEKVLYTPMKKGLLT